MFFTPFVKKSSDTGFDPSESVASPKTDPKTCPPANPSRRRFLQQQGLALLAAGSLPLLPRRLFAADTPDIAVTTGHPAAAVRKAVDMLGGMKRFVKPGQKVVIKPNMSFAVNVDRASNTHPAAVRELILMCREAGAASVLALDHTLQNPQLCLAPFLEDFQKATGESGKNVIMALNDDRYYREADLPEAAQMKSARIMKDVLDADVLIAAPTAKSHSSAGVSLSMKGMMGLVYNRGVMHSRYDLHESIVDLAGRLKPDLVVVDASRVLMNGGPGGPGKVFLAETVIASTDMVAADAATVSRFEWYGQRFAPRQVKHVRIAHERNIGRMDISARDIQTEYAAA